MRCCCCYGPGSPEEFDETLLDILTQRDDTVESFCPNDHDALIALSRDVKKNLVFFRKQGTHDKGSALLAVCVWKREHGVEYLDAGFGVDIDRAIFWSAVRAREDKK